MEEVLDMLQLDKSESNSSDADSQNSDEEVLALSYCATVGIQGRKTIRVQGLIQDQEVLILIETQGALVLSSVTHWYNSLRCLQHPSSQFKWQ